MDLSKPQFENSQLTEVTGLSSYTIQTWATRGLIGSLGRTGSGQRRLYSAVEVIRIRVLQKLMAFGLPISLASEMARLNDNILGFTYDWNSSSKDEILLCITRAINGGYRSELVNMTALRSSRPVESDRPEDSLIVRYAERLAAEATVRGGTYVMDVGELIAQTIGTLVKMGGN